MSPHSIGHVLLRLGTYLEARVYYEQAPAIKHELGVRFYQDGASPNTGLPCHHMGSHQAAREYGELELRIAGEIDDRTAQGWLQKRGAGIHDKELCRLLLENVAANQDMRPAPDND